MATMETAAFHQKSLRNLENTTEVDFFVPPLQGQTCNAEGIVVSKEIGVESLLVQCRVATVVHGTLTDAPGSPAASLLVFRFVFNPRKADHRFVSATIKFKFSDNVAVKDIAPDNAWRVDKIPTNISDEKGINLGLQGTVVGITPSATANWQHTEGTTVSDAVSISGSSEPLDYSKTVNGVVWDLSENPQARKGIPSFLQTAVLVQRDAGTAGSKFQAALSIRCRVYAPTGADWRKIHHWTTGDAGDRQERKEAEASGYAMPLYYDAEQPGVNPGKVDAKNLGALVLDKYKALVHMRDWDVPAAGSTPAGSTGAPAGTSPSGTTPSSTTPAASTTPANTSSTTTGSATTGSTTTGSTTTAAA